MKSRTIPETCASRSLAERGERKPFRIGRLKPGVTAEAAAPALKGLAANLEAAFPVEQKNQTLMTAPLYKFATSTDPEDAETIRPTIGGLLAANGRQWFCSSPV